MNFFVKSLSTAAALVTEFVAGLTENTQNDSRAIHKLFLCTVYGYFLDVMYLLIHRFIHISEPKQQPIFYN